MGCSTRKIGCQTLRRLCDAATVALRSSSGTIHRCPSHYYVRVRKFILGVCAGLITFGERN